MSNARDTNFYNIFLPLVLSDMESMIEATYISHISTTKTAFISTNHNMSSQQL